MATISLNVKILECDFLHLCVLNKKTYFSYRLKRSRYPQIQILNGIYSQGCIDLLAEKFNVDVNPGMSDEDKAVYESFRALIEDRLIPMMALERFYWLKVSNRDYLSCSPVATMVYSLPDLSTVKKIVLVIEKNF